MEHVPTMENTRLLLDGDAGANKFTKKEVEQYIMSSTSLDDKSEEEARGSSARRVSMMTEDDPDAEASDEEEFEEEDQKTTRVLLQQTWDYPLTQSEKHKRLSLTLDTERRNEAQNYQHSVQSFHRLEKDYAREKGLRVIHESSKAEADQRVQAARQTMKALNSTISSMVNAFGVMFRNKDLPAELDAVWSEILLKRSSTSKNLDGKGRPEDGDTLIAQAEAMQNRVAELFRVLADLDEEERDQTFGGRSGEARSREAPKAKAEPKAKAKATPNPDPDENQYGLFGRAKGVLGDLFGNWDMGQGGADGSWNGPDSQAQLPDQ